MSRQWLNTPDWDAAERYWTAFWHGELLDRPPLMITVPASGHDGPVPEARTPEEKHGGAEFALRHNEATLPRSLYLGEALPVSKTLMSAWCAAYGQQLEYHPDTIWIRPSVTDWAAAPDWATAWDDSGWRGFKQSYARLCAGAHAGGYFVGLPPLLVPNDLLSVLRGVENFLLDLITEPERVLHALGIMQRNYVRMWNEADAIRDPSHGYGNWWPIWCPERLRIVQSDVSCMISPEMFETFILPELHVMSEDVDHMFYHLDGPGALHHLEMICSVPKIKAIQWVPGAGNPPNGPHWMDLYKKIQSLGRAVWLGAAPSQLEFFIRELDPRLLLLGTRAFSVDEAQELKRQVVRWTAQYRR